MGAYRATDTKLHRDVAIKFFLNLSHGMPSEC
jgi:hypothetical protein